MALHLVGENLDKTRSHCRAGTGTLVQLMRGIYVDAKMKLTPPFSGMRFALPGISIPHLKQDRLALKLNGKDHNLRRKNFRTFAATAGLKAADADAAMDDMLRRMAEEIEQITIPKALECRPAEEAAVKEVLDICRSRIELFA